MVATDLRVWRLWALFEREQAGFYEPRRWSVSHVNAGTREREGCDCEVKSHVTV